MLTSYGSIEETRARFRWQIPERFNIAEAICNRWARSDPGRLAIIDAGQGAGPARQVTYGELAGIAAQLSHLLKGAGVTPGTPVGILLPQGVITAAAHVAALQMGAVSLPLFTLFGPEALLHRLKDSGARVVITDAEGAAKLAPLRAGLPDLARVFCTDGALHGAEALEPALADLPRSYDAAGTGPDDPAILIYTSGTTGAPKGALHGHRVLLGHLPGVEMSHDFLPQPGDRIWTPADWAWIGGLLDVLMPALYHGVPVVACRFARFTGAAAFDLMERYGVRNVFLPPTALKIMRQEPDPPRLNLRSVASGGEPLGEELLDWGRRVLGCTINEFYGQTECNMIVSSCAALGPPAPRVMGWPVPGHEVEVIAPETGAVLAAGEEGEIAVRAPDPVMFLRYWNDPEATRAKFVGDPADGWLLTGDRGVMQPDGRIRFVGRADDVISSGGYRIGPGEIEDCLLAHPAVQLAGAVGVPDPLRGQAVAAVVVPAPGHAPGPALAEELQAWVRERLAAHEYPRLIRFAGALPMTTTGKIIRAELRRQLASEAGN